MQQCNFIYKNIDTNIIQPFKLQISRGKEGRQNVVFTVVDSYKTLYLIGFMADIYTYLHHFCPAQSSFSSLSPLSSSVLVWLSPASLVSTITQLSSNIVSRDLVDHYQYKEEILNYPSPLGNIVNDQTWTNPREILRWILLVVKLYHWTDEIDVQCCNVDVHKWLSWLSLLQQTCSTPSSSYTIIYCVDFF